VEGIESGKLSHDSQPPGRESNPEY